MCQSWPLAVSGAWISAPISVVNCLRAQAPRVGDGIAAVLPEMIGEGEEVVAGVPVEIGDRLGRQPAVRARRMRVQVAAPEPPLAGEWHHVHAGVLVEAPTRHSRGAKRQREPSRELDRRLGLSVGPDKADRRRTARVGARSLSPPDSHRTNRATRNDRAAPPASTAWSCSSGRRSTRGRSTPAARSRRPQPAERRAPTAGIGRRGRADAADADSRPCCQ